MRKIPLFLIFMALSCTTTQTTFDMNPLAERYVKLVLAVGEHDADYVDAFYGPKEWREAVKASKPSLDAIHADVTRLGDELRATPKPADEMSSLRRDYLIRQTASMLTRVEMLRGKKLKFDEESKALYDAVSPHHAESYYQGLLTDLDRELPGEGTMAERLDRFRQTFIIPKDKLDTVFRAAIEGCKARTLQQMQLPPGETFNLEYVTNKSWSGYNWYQGEYKSLIQINTDLPIFIDRAIDLACHEGYPGHHVYNALLEKSLVRDRGWVEFSVYPLFSPQSLIAEGSANYGIDIAFPGNERAEYERQNLFPLAGIDPALADKYYRVQALTAKLAYAGNEAARRYLDGEITADAAAEWLTKYALMAPARAKQRVKFMDQYRCYVINYNLGRDLVAKHVEKLAGNDRAKRWQVFTELLSSPRLPSGLAR